MVSVHWRTIKSPCNSHSKSPWNRSTFWPRSPSAPWASGEKGRSAALGAHRHAAGAGLDRGACAGGGEIPGEKWHFERENHGKTRGQFRKIWEEAWEIIDFTFHVLHSRHSTLYTLHSTLYTENTLRFALHTLHSTHFHGPQSPLHTLDYTLHSHSTLTVFTLHCTGTVAGEECARLLK